MNISLKSIKLHHKLRGKLSVVSKIKLNKRFNLTLAYTPGVAWVVKAIKLNRNDVYNLTGKHNAIAVVTDGSAVLGLGNVGPQAALPVMEGKCAIFKEFAGIDAYPICLATQNTEEIITTIKNIAPGFGAINLEDISAPRCFEIEKGLQNLGIPVIHDDQHATAIVVLAGLLNAAKVVHKNLDECKIVIAGCGAAGTAVAKLLSFSKLKNILILDSQGIISQNRPNLSPYKQELVKLTNKNNTDGDLMKAAQNADVLIGVSVAGIFTQQIIKSMEKNPIVFALANPDPEILPQNAKKWGAKVIATGRSDYPNQINNALVFPGFFKGLLQKKHFGVTMKMKIKAAFALAKLVKKPVEQKIIPSIFDHRVVPILAESMK